jgi:hypothetical protein
LQCAFLAERDGAPVTLLSAALLHDIGHLLYDAGDRPALRGIDDQHEELGARLLLDAFGPAVAEPVRLHVAAKRYLAPPILTISVGSLRFRKAVWSCKAGHSLQPRLPPLTLHAMPVEQSASGCGTRQPNCLDAKRHPSSIIGRRSFLQ